VRRPVKRTLFTVRVLLLGRPTGIGSTLRFRRASMRRAAGGHGSAAWAGKGAGPGGRAIRRVGGPTVVNGPSAFGRRGRL